MSMLNNLYGGPQFYVEIVHPAEYNDLVIIFTFGTGGNHV